MHIGTKITDIECGLKKSWFKGGRLWIFAGHMCFYSLMFGSEQKILIKNEGIRDVKVLKAKTAAKSSIDIGTKTGRCCLTSFKSKDGFEKCIRLIRNIIQTVKVIQILMTSPLIIMMQNNKDNIGSNNHFLLSMVCPLL